MLSEDPNSKIYAEQSLKLQHDPSAEFSFPFDLNKLCNFSFDTLKDSIEYLARQQLEMK